jgi:hypothetical protein
MIAVAPDQGDGVSQRRSVSALVQCLMGRFAPAMVPDAAQ